MNGVTCRNKVPKAPLPLVLLHMCVLGDLCESFNALTDCMCEAITVLASHDSTVCLLRLEKQPSIKSTSVAYRCGHAMWAFSPQLRSTELPGYIVTLACVLVVARVSQRKRPCSASWHKHMCIGCCASVVACLFGCGLICMFDWVKKCMHAWFDYVEGCFAA